MSCFPPKAFVWPPWETWSYAKGTSRLIPLNYSYLELYLHSREQVSLLLASKQVEHFHEQCRVSLKSDLLMECETKCTNCFRNLMLTILHHVGVSTLGRSRWGWIEALGLEIITPILFQIGLAVINKTSKKERNGIAEFGLNLRQIRKEQLWRRNKMVRIFREVVRM